MLLDKVILGHSLDSVLHASKSNTHLIYNADSLPFRFEKLSKQLSYNGAVFEYEKDALCYILFDMSLRGLLVNSATAVKVSVKDDMVSVSYADHRPTSFTTHQLLVGEANKLNCLNEVHIHQKELKVYDWLNAAAASRHHLECVDLEPLCVDKVLFYDSLRPDVISGSKDAVIISTVPKDKINEFEYSGTFFRLLLEKKMKKLGIRVKNGSSNGGQPIFKYAMFETPTREVKCLNQHVVEEGGIIKKL